jgi:hypothetical protein
VIVGYDLLKIGENKGTIGRVFRASPFIGLELVFTENGCFRLGKGVLEEWG